MKNRTIGLFSVITIIAFGLLFIQGCGQGSTPKLQTEYQAIMLTNNQVVFGKAEFLGNGICPAEGCFLYPQPGQPRNEGGK